MKEIMKLLNETESITGDNTPFMQLFGDWSGNIIAHDKILFEFTSKEDLRQKLNLFINKNKGK